MSVRIVDPQIAIVRLESRDGLRFLSASDDSALSSVVRTVLGQAPSLRILAKA
jgi:hypothetical protein